MSAPVLTPVPADRPDAPGPPAVEPRCDACPHPAADHDAIGLRFCRATLAAALDRGCVCRPA